MLLLGLNDRTYVVVDQIAGALGERPRLTSEVVDGCRELYICRNLTFALSQDGTKLFVRVTDGDGRQYHGSWKLWFDALSMMLMLSEIRLAAEAPLESEWLVPRSNCPGAPALRTTA